MTSKKSINKKPAPSITTAQVCLILSAGKFRTEVCLESDFRSYILAFCINICHYIKTVAKLSVYNA